LRQARLFQHGAHKDEKWNCDQDIVGHNSPDSQRQEVEKIMPKVASPKMTETPPSVNATGKPSSNKTNSVANMIKGKASIICFSTI